MPPKNNTQQIKQKKRQPKVFARPPSSTFRSAAAQLDAINGKSAGHRKPRVFDLSEDEDWVEDISTASPSRPGRTAFDANNTHRGQPATVFSSERMLHSPQTQDTVMSRSGRKGPRVISDSEVEYDDEEDLPLASSHLSTTRKNSRKISMERHSNRLGSEGIAMPLCQTRLPRGISEEDLEIDMIGWDTLKVKTPRTPRRVWAVEDPDVQTPRRESLRRLGPTPVLMTPPRTAPKTKHSTSFAAELSNTDQHVRNFPIVQAARQANGPPTTYDSPQVKVKRSRAYDFIDSVPISERYHKRADPTYDPIRDSSHPIHDESNIPLPGVEDAYARQERARWRAEKRTSIWMQMK